MMTAYSNKAGAIRRASAGNLDGNTLSVGDTVAVTERDISYTTQPSPDKYLPSTGRVHTGVDTELRDQIIRNISPDGYGRNGGSKDSGGRKSGSGELHVE